MILKEGELLRCPKCGGKRFCATAHVTQDWELDEHGVFQASLNDCVEVTHEPDADDIWDCPECGFSGSGREFLHVNGKRKFWGVSQKYFDSGKVKANIFPVEADKKPESTKTENKMYDEYIDYFDTYEEAAGWAEQARKA